jgi:hypothetical protein
MSVISLAFLWLRDFDRAPILAHPLLTGPTPEYLTESVLRFSKSGASNIAFEPGLATATASARSGWG